MKVISTDVLVLGSGLAGLCAAITCKEKGLDVLVCSKTSPGLGNCTTVSQGAFSNSIGDYSVEDHRKNTLAAGHSLNDTGQVAILVNNAEASVKKLHKYGVELQGRAKGLNSVSKALGKEGISITEPMVRYARSRGVNFMSPFFAWEIINDNGKAQGVWGFSKSDNNPTAIRAQATILAAGGGGALYSRSDNPPTITGDGYAMAYRAGLPLIDMEFVQFYPLSTAYAGKPGRFLPPIIAEAGEFLNAENENLVQKYNIEKRPLAVASRDSLSRALALEVFNGHGIDNAIKLDLKNFEERWAKAKGLAGRADNEALKSWFKGFLQDRDFLLVMPVCHFFMGGVVADGSCRTKLPGLFAAGEVVGGLHGANRLGGNALSETVVFGDLAGKSAAEYALMTEDAGSTALESWVDSRHRAMVHEKGSQGQFDGRSIKKKIRDVMWEHAGLIRSEASLLKAREELSRYKDVCCGQVKVKNMASFLEFKNMLLVAGMVVEAALMRKESRGSHFRIDYPNVDDGWLKHVEIQRVNDNMDIRTPEE